MVETFCYLNLIRSSKRIEMPVGGRKGKQEIKSPNHYWEALLPINVDGVYITMCFIIIYYAVL